MKNLSRILLIAIFSLVLVSNQQAQEPVYWDMVQKIMAEEFNNSEIMENASWLCDVFGPRHAKSPSYLAAANWAREKLASYGLSNADLEPFEFGVGWVNHYTSVHMMKPRYAPLLAYPQSWSSGTKGKVQASVIHINFDEISSESELNKYKGKLKDVIVFMKPKQNITPHFEPMATRYSKEELDEWAAYKIGPEEPRRRRDRDRKGRLPRQQIIDFVFAEGAIAIVAPCGREDYGTVMVNEVSGRPWKIDAPTPPTELAMSAEQYNRILRILEKDIPVEMEMEIKVEFTDKDLTDYNVVAEIPGTDLADEVVICGGHLDANSAGTGAADNVAGAVVAMETLRILKALEIKPRRTIRVALWGSEESGLIGSRAYVKEHLYDPETGGKKPGYDKFAGYFNLDSGTGKIRGINLKDFEAALPVFTEWLRPLHALGATHLLAESDVGSDCRAFKAAGLPGFSFVQDRIDYDNRSYHTNMDVYDRLIEEDLMQAAVVMATFVYHAAMRDEVLPGTEMASPEDRD